jgi:hypothetical protein
MGPAVENFRFDGGLAEKRSTSAWRRQRGCWRNRRSRRHTIELKAKGSECAA